jgi:tripartite-type tricarboxylate transporter receptor subunit TctC
MSLPRRLFLHLAAGAAALPAISRVARAQAYPTRPVRLIVGFGPGGAADIVARLIGQWLSERLGRPFVIEDRPGAASNLATEAVVNSPPAINATLYEHLNFKFVRDIAPIASIWRGGPAVMEVSPSFPAKTVPEFIAYAKANAGRINMASAGIGSINHIYGELFKLMAGVDMVHVPYRGGAPAVSDLLAGQVQVMFEFMASALPYVRSGGLRALAVTSGKRLQALPEVPSVGEFLPGFEQIAWFGIVAPRQTPPEIVNRLNHEINLTLDDPEVRSRISAFGSEPLSGSPADFAELIARDAEKSGEIIRKAGIKAA